MCRARSLEFLNLHPEIEWTLQRLRKEKGQRIPTMIDGGNQNGENQEQWALRDYFRPIVNDNYSGIWRQTINTNNFELKLALINMVQQNQYGRLAHENPNVHLATFLEICDTVKLNGVTEDVIQMRLPLFLLGTRHGVGFNLYNQPVSVLGMSWHKSSLPSSLCLQRIHR